MSISPTPNFPTSPVTQQYVLFRQGRSFFAVKLVTVSEILPCAEQPITAVPNTLPFLLGLTNVRGEILAVADFGRLINTETVDIRADSSRIIVLEATKSQAGAKVRCGLAVSQIEGVIPIDSEQVVSAVEVSTQLAPLLCGFYAWDDCLVMVVDAQEIASSNHWKSIGKLF